MKADNDNDDDDADDDDDDDDDDAGSPVEVSIGNAGIVVSERHVESCVHARHLEWLFHLEFGQNRL